MYKKEFDKAKQEELTAMKIECQNALALQMHTLQETLSQKEAFHIHEQEQMKGAHETERQRVRLLASDKENLQRELLATQSSMREALAETDLRFKRMEELLTAQQAQQERKSMKTSFKRDMPGASCASCASATEIAKQ